MISVAEAKYDDVLVMRKEIMYPDKDIEYVKLADDEQGIHLGVFDDGQLMTVGSIFMHADRNLQLRKLATQKEMQHRGYASALIKWLFDYAKDVKLNSICCNARKDAIDFYKKFGFEETDEEFTKDGLEYVIVKKTFPQ